MTHLDCRENEQNDLSKFNDNHKDGNWLVWYHADWCGHCKNMAKNWEQLTNKLGNKMNTAKIQDTVINKLKYKAEVRGFPTIELRKNGKKVAEYNGDRSSDSLEEFANSNNNYSQSGGFFSLFGGRKVRSNKGKKRLLRHVSGRKVRSNKGVRRGPRSGKTRSGQRFRPIPVVHKARKVRSNKGKKRTPYGPRTGKTRSGKKFRTGGGLMNMIQSGMDRYENLVGNYHH